MSEESTVSGQDSGFAPVSLPNPNQIAAEQAAQASNRAALSEPSVESLSDLFSRDPEGWSLVDRAAVVAAFREQRKRWEAVEAVGGKKAPKPTAARAVGLLHAPAAASDLGL
jgi:hypothetical protein